jgi:hypothetical protein
MKSGEFTGFDRGAREGPKDGGHAKDAGRVKEGRVKEGGARRILGG